jgi:hypothetical protein
MSECLSANDNAIKLRGDHKLRQARDQALVCSSASCPGEVRDACQLRVKDLNAAIPTVVFEVKDPSGNDLSAVVVKMDGQPFADHLDGTAVPVDPGDHAFSFAAMGQPEVDKSVVIYEGDKSRRERIQMGGSLASPPPASTLPAPAPLVMAPSSETQPIPQPTTTGRSTQKVIGLTLGGVGVVGIGVGSVLGLLTLSAWSSVKNACGSGGPSNCAASSPSSVTADRNAAETDGTISTVAFIAGAGLVATGLVVFLTGTPHGDKENPSPAMAVVPTFGPSQAGVALSGAF